MSVTPFPVSNESGDVMDRLSEINGLRQDLVGTSGRRATGPPRKRDKPHEAAMPECRLPSDQCHE